MITTKTSKIITVSKAAEIMGVTGGRVRQMLASGELEGEKFGSVWAVQEKSAVSHRMREVGSVGRPRSVSKNA